jgi:hypothetical protein
LVDVKWVWLLASNSEQSTHEGHEGHEEELSEETFLENFLSRMEFHYLIFFMSFIPFMSFMCAFGKQEPQFCAGALQVNCADSKVVFGSATLARLSHVRTGFASGTSGFGAACISDGPAGAPPRPPCGT